MGSIPRTNALATQRRAITGSRKGVREKLEAHLASGLVLTFSEPYADPDARSDQPGRVRVDVVLLVDEPEPARVITGELVPVRQPVRVADPPVIPAQARRARRRLAPAINRHTVIRTFEIAGGVVVTGGVGFLGYELVRLVVSVVVWIGSNGPMLLGGAVFLAVVLLAAGSAGCSMCGRR